MKSRVVVEVALIVCISLFGLNPTWGISVHGQSAQTLWQAAAGQDLSSVAWSPDGKYVAFVASPRIISDEVPSADIWLLNMSDAKVMPRHLIHVSAAEGIPSALFWTSGKQLAWAAAGINGKGFTFLSTDVDTAKPEVFLDCGLRFGGITSTIEESAPDDVYWDSRSSILWFTAVSVDEYGEPTGTWVFFYDSKKKDISAMALNGMTAVTLCSWTDPDADPDPEIATDGTTLYYTAEPTSTRRAYFALFRLNMTMPRSKAKIWAPDRPISNPRISPDGAQLAWLQVVKHGWVLIIHDLKTKQSWRLVETLNIGGVSSGCCPYAWSPDSKRIAYTDGSRIKIVEVAPKAIPGKK